MCMKLNNLQLKKTYEATDFPVSGLVHHMKKKIYLNENQFTEARRHLTKI